MAQTRIVLKDADRPLVESIMSATGLGSPSDVVTMLLRRYGSHYLDWFHTNPHRCKEVALMEEGASHPPPKPATVADLKPPPLDPGEGLDPISL